MNEQISKLIDSYQEQFVSMLSRWIRVPSVKSEGEDGAPFGPEIRRMLDMAMVDAETLGFITHDYDGYACDITLGDESKEAIAVLAHLDVVPAGDGWQVDPFAAVRDGDRLYGRGTNDDKGPALAALFAMKAIRDAGIPLKRSIRLILGCDEESGWEDMEYYCEHAKMPDMGFSPDASFPLINTEKGMLHLALRAPMATDGLQVKQLHTGERMNVIPGECVCVVEGDQSLVHQVEDFAAKTGMDYRAEVTTDGVKLTATGIPGHSAYPEGCRNAIGMMLLLLRELGVQGALRTLADVYGMEHDGASLGIACADDISGALTCNMGILHMENGQLFCTLDCRCPVSADLEALKTTALSRLTLFKAEVADIKPPHHVPADSELVTSLLSAYHEETGLPAQPQSTGGGTYAKVLKNGVAFGAAFPDDEDLAHQAGEYISISKMMTAMKIYANALLRLCAE